MELAELIPLSVGAAVLPAWIVVVLFLLRDGGVRIATAFVAGAITIRLVQGVVFGLVVRAPAESNGKHNAGLIASTLLLAVGIVMLVAAAKHWRKDDDLDSLPRKWIETFRGLSAIKAFGMGALFLAIAVKQWIFTLSALAVIEQSPLNPAGSVLAYVLFVLAAQSLLVAPIIVCVAAPAQSGRLLDATQHWLLRHNRPIVVVFSTILGAWFLWKGTTGLIRLQG
jgi:hypothetical protein